MSKKLIVILALAFVVGLSASAFAEVQNVKISGDINVVGLDRSNLNFKSNGGDAGNEFATISRIKIDANLTDNVDVTFRLLNERAWGSLDNDVDNTNGHSSAVDVDLAYVTLKEFMKSTISVPVTMVIGRQNVLIGSGLLVGAAGTNQYNNNRLPRYMSDLSARGAFDGVASVWEFTPEFTVTAAYVKAAEGAITDGHDVDVYVADAVYKLGENFFDTNLEATYVGQRQTTEGNVSNYGVRATSAPIKDLNVEAEYVYQMNNSQAVGSANGENKAAEALRLGANYTFSEVSMKPGLGVDYTRLSKYWNPMQESISPADLANFIFQNTNLNIIGATLTAKPLDDLGLRVRYANLSLAKDGNGANYVSSGTNDTYAMNAGKKDLGYEVDAGLTYDYTSDVQFGLNYGIFDPGKAFSSANRKAASQVLGSMKVSF